MSNVLADKLIELATHHPHHTVMQTKTSTKYIRFTYQDIYSKAQKIAELLQDKFTVKAGDRVAIILENTPQWSMTYFGIMLLDAVAVPIDPQATTKDKQYCLEHSGAKVVFDPEPRKLAPQTIKPLDGIASILYTSGTTGVPKGVLLTHENLLSNYQSIAKLKIINSKHNLLSLLPLHHAFPFMVTLLTPLFSKAMITYVADLSSDTILTAMQETGVTALVGVPQLFYLLHNNLEAKLKQVPWVVKKFLKHLLRAKIHQAFGNKLQFFVSGGAKLDPLVIQFFNKLGFKVLEGYGLSETSPVVSFPPVNKPKIGSVGKAVPDVHIKIDSSDQKGIGEILIAGPNVMRGYYKMPKETNEVLKDGWFYSGDLGFLDAENYLYITGRKKELIVLSSGKNIAPDEVESHYLQSPYIKELCVLAVGGRGEDRLMAVIVPDLNYFKQKGEIKLYETIKWDLENWLQNYPSYKRIMGFVLAPDELPKTRLGKLKRFAIKDLYQNELLGNGKSKLKPEVIPDIKLTPLGENILEILQRHLHNKNIELDDHLEIDLGIDSLSRVELLSVLSRELQIYIPGEIAANIFTVNDLVTNLEKLKDQTDKPVEIEATSWQEILQQQLDTNLIKKIGIKQTWYEKLHFKVISWFGMSLLKIFWRLKGIGIENLPKDRNFILCPNHVSYIDALVVMAAAPKWLRDKTFFLGETSYFEAPVLRNLVRTLKVIPVDAAKNLVGAMQAAAYVLKQNKVVGIFPEGARSIDGKLRQFKKGVGILAKELNVNLVPVYIEGAFESWPRGKKLPRLHKLSVRFGKPCEVTELEAIGAESNVIDPYEAITQGIKNKIIELAGRD